MDGNYGQNQNPQDYGQNMQNYNQQQGWKDPNMNQQGWKDPNTNQQGWQNPNTNQQNGQNPNVNQPNQSGYYNGYTNVQPGGYQNANGYTNVPGQGYTGNGNVNSYAPNNYGGPIMVSNAAPQKTGGLAVGSLVCGIICIIGFWSFITLIVAIVGVVLGIVNNAQDNPNKGMAVAGIILNIIGFLLTILFIAILLV